VLGVSEDLALGAVVVTILVLLLPGGVRSMSWAQDGVDNGFGANEEL
jgi:hypothetical protein